MSEAKHSKRGRVELYGDILHAIVEDFRVHGEARMTRVQGTVNMPYDRFRDTVDELVQLRMVTLEKKEGYYEVQLEKKGLDYLEHYEAVRGFLEAFALDGKAE